MGCRFINHIRKYRKNVTGMRALSTMFMGSFIASRASPRHSPNRFWGRYIWNFMCWNYITLVCIICMSWINSSPHGSIPSSSWKPKTGLASVANIVYYVYQANAIYLPNHWNSKSRYGFSFIFHQICIEKGTFISVAFQKLLCRISMGDPTLDMMRQNTSIITSNNAYIYSSLSYYVW